MRLNGQAEQISQLLLIITIQLKVLFIMQKLMNLNLQIIPQHSAKNDSLKYINII